MTKDMEKRISNRKRQKGEISEGQSQNQTLSTIVTQALKDFRTSTSEKTQLKNCAKERILRLQKAYESFDDIFRSPKYSFLAIAAPFSRKIGHVVRSRQLRYESSDYSETLPISKLEYEKSLLGNAGTYLILRLDANEALKIDLLPQNDDDILKIWKYKHVVTPMQRESVGLTINPPFYGRTAWTENFSHSKTFDNWSNAEDYIRDQLASAIIENQENFIGNLLIRGTKVGSVAAVFLWASGAFGQEHDPANDPTPFEPERDVPGLFLDAK